MYKIMLVEDEAIIRRGIKRGVKWEENGFEIAAEAEDGEEALKLLEETGVDVVVTDLVSVKSSRKVLTYANGDNTMYMDHLFICRPDPNGNTEPFVGDEESLSVGWFSPDALPEPLAATTVERMAYVREYLKAKANGDSHAQFAFNGTIR